MNRKSNFENKEAAISYFKSKQNYANFSKDSFNDFIENGLKKTDKGLTLRFSSKIEAEIYMATYTRFPSDILKIKKGLLLVGSKSNLFHSSDKLWWKFAIPNFKIINLKMGHLMPFE